MTFSGSKEYCVRGTCPSYLCAFAPHSLKLVEEWGSVLRTAGTYACHLHGQTFRIAVPRTWNSLPPVPEMTYTVSSGMLNPSIPYHTIPYQLFTATSPFANHQPTTVPVWAQDSSLQTRLLMILPPRTIEEWTYLLTNTSIYFFHQGGYVFVGINLFVCLLAGLHRK